MIPITLPDAAWEGAQDGIEALLDKWLVAPGVHVAKGQLDRLRRAGESRDGH